MDIYTEIIDKLGVTKLEKIEKSDARGCISAGKGFHTNNGDIFVKLNNTNDALPMFYGEMLSLKAIKRTKTIFVPEPFCIVEDPKNDGGGIVLEYLDLKSINNWSKLGQDLADLHLFNSILKRKKEKLKSWIGIPPRSDDTYEELAGIEIKHKIDEKLIDEMEYVEQFGFETATCCGVIPQQNEWHDNWIEFYARNRLNYQINLIIEKSGDREIVEYWSNLQLKIDSFFKDLKHPIEPALLHGDLWSGNVSQVGETPVAFDPSSFYGHSEFDLSIATLFGGFDQQFFDKYFEKIPKQKGFQMRHELYKLFHTLNHWNHFGSHKRQTKEIMKKLIENATN